ncbi:MAG: hypothetical protein HOP09_04000 [Hyphomicrobium sp.]|nr:hypothetical protein [Hyphomicrobium sp.]
MRKIAYIAASLLCGGAIAVKAESASNVLVGCWSIEPAARGFYRKMCFLSDGKGLAVIGELAPPFAARDGLLHKGGLSFTHFTWAIQSGDRVVLSGHPCRILSGSVDESIF